MDGVVEAAADERTLGTANTAFPQATGSPAGNRVSGLLGEAPVERLLGELQQELRPVGALEHIMVRDLARKAAGMDLFDSAARAATRQSAAAISELLAATGASEWSPDAVLAGAVAAEGPDRLTRHGLVQTRGFYRALKTLNELRTMRDAAANDAAANLPNMPPAFASEAACEAFLAERFQRGLCACATCGETGGYLQSARKAWECAGCSRQVGLRTGTVMARSPLPLLVWFDAVRWLFWRPTISAAELAVKLGLTRLTTVRTLACRIRAAMAHEKASSRLAGLDEHFARGAPAARCAPEPGAPPQRVGRNP